MLYSKTDHLNWSYASCRLLTNLTIPWMNHSLARECHAPPSEHLQVATLRACI